MERRPTAEDEVRALRDVAAQAEAALRAGPGRAHEGALAASRLAGELKERLTALRRRVLLAADWAHGAAPVELAKHVGLLRDHAMLSASVTALKAQLTNGRAAMGGRGGGEVVEGLTEVAKSMGLQWDAQRHASMDESQATEVHFSAANEALLLDCHALPPPASPRLELHLTMRTPNGPAVLAPSAEVLHDLQEAVKSHDWACVTRVLRYITRLYQLCPSHELRLRLDQIPSQLSNMLKEACPDSALSAVASAEGARVSLYSPPVPLPGELQALHQLYVQIEHHSTGSELGPSLVYIARFHPPLLLPLPVLAQLRALLISSHQPQPGEASALMNNTTTYGAQAGVAALLSVSDISEVHLWSQRFRIQVQAPGVPLLTVLLLPFSSLAHAPFIVRLAQQAALYARLLRSCFAPHQPNGANLNVDNNTANCRPVEIALSPPESITLVLKAGGTAANANWAFLYLSINVALGAQLSVTFLGPSNAGLSQAPLVSPQYLTSVLQASHSIPVLLYYLLKALGDVQ